MCVAWICNVTIITVRAFVAWIFNMTSVTLHCPSCTLCLRYVYPMVEKFNLCLLSEFVDAVTRLTVTEHPRYCHHDLRRQLQRWRRRRFSLRYGSDVSSLFWNLFAKLFFGAKALTSVKAPCAWYCKFYYSYACASVSISAYRPTSLSSFIWVFSVTLRLSESSTCLNWVMSGKDWPLLWFGYWKEWLLMASL
jgi:hypothetical protein